MRSIEIGRIFLLIEGKNKYMNHAKSIRNIIILEKNKKLVFTKLKTMHIIHS